MWLLQAISDGHQDTVINHSDLGNQDLGADQLGYWVATVFTYGRFRDYLSYRPNLKAGYAVVELIVLIVYFGVERDGNM